MDSSLSVLEMLLYERTEGDISLIFSDKFYNSEVGTTDFSFF